MLNGNPLIGPDLAAVTEASPISPRDSSDRHLFGLGGASEWDQRRGAPGGRALADEIAKPAARSRR